MTGNKDLKNEEDIEKALRLGEYIKNGMCLVGYGTST